jgi:hypothetical protein
MCRTDLKGGSSYSSVCIRIHENELPVLLHLKPDSLSVTHHVHQHQTPNPDHFLVNCLIKMLIYTSFFVLTYSFASINLIMSRSKWPHALRHETLLLARKLGSWDWIPLEARMSVCSYSVFLLFYVCKYRPSDGLIPCPRSPTDCVWIKKLKMQPRPTRAVEPYMGGWMGEWMVGSID